MRKKTTVAETAEKTPVEKTSEETAAKEAVVETTEENTTEDVEEKAPAKKTRGTRKTVAKETEEKVETLPKRRGRKPSVKKEENKKTSAQKEEMKPEVFIQFQGREDVIAEVIERAKQAFVNEGHRASSIKSMQIYLKPEESAAYYVINQKQAGRVDLF